MFVLGCSTLGRDKGRKKHSAEQETCFFSFFEGKIKRKNNTNQIYFGSYWFISPFSLKKWDSTGLFQFPHEETGVSIPEKSSFHVWKQNLLRMLAIFFPFSLWIFSRKLLYLRRFVDLWSYGYLEELFIFPQKKRQRLSEYEYKRI